MKKYILLLSILVVASSLAGLAGPGTAQAYSPTLVISNNSGSGFILSVSNGVPNSSVQMNYTIAGSSLPTTITNFGTTDYNGYFTTTVNGSSYGLTGGAQVYVTVAGQQSNIVTVGSVAGCGIYGCGSYGGGSLSLSQTSVNLNIGQITNITSNNLIYNSFYISSNSNPSVVSASTLGNTITLSGLGVGTSNVTVCNGANCGSIYVTVSNGSGYGYSGALTLSQTNVNLSVGQTLYVTVNSNYSGSPYISSNSNSAVVSASVSGSQISLYGLSIGSSTVNVCVSGGQCASVYVTVGNSSGYGGSFPLSQTNLNLTVGQTSYVTSYSASGGSLYIASNSNSAVVSASVSGSQISFYGLSSGSSTVKICSYNNSQCASVYVTVGSVLGATTGAVQISDDFFTPRIQTVPVGTNVVWTNSGNMSHTVTADDNSFNSNALLPGASFARVFNTPGTYFYHCIFHGGVGGVGMSGQIVVSGSGGYGGIGNLTLSQSNLNMNLGQSTTVTGYNTVGGSFLSVTSNSNPQVASASATGNTVYVYGAGVGSTTINICSNSGYGCANLYVTVGNGYGYGSGNLSLSQTSVYLSAGQSSTVTAYNALGYNLVISSNSNPSAVNASVSGNNVYLNGLTSGTSNLVVCAANNSCSTVYVTVSGGYNNSNVYLSPTSLNLSLGQTATVIATGPYNYSFYAFSNTNPYVAAISFQNNVGTVVASGQGYTSISICQNNTSQCAPLVVNVNPTAYPYAVPNALSLLYPSIGGNILGTSIYSNGQLISENGVVFIVYKNTKTGFLSASVFRALGYNFGNVIEVGNSGLADSGYVVHTTSLGHPWGTWVKSGQTVYFVHESGLIPVPNLNTLASNGGSSSWVVPANIYDFHQPLLSTMIPGDPRLQ